MSYIEKIFNMIDLDHNGFLTANEVDVILQNINKTMKGRHYTEQDRKLFIEKLDTNNDGKLDFNEFKICFMPLIEFLFTKVDLDTNGLLCSCEADKILAKLNSVFGRNYDDKVRKEFIAKLDKNGDGNLDFEEFKYAFFNGENSKK